MEFISGVLRVPAGDNVVTSPIVFPDDRPCVIKGEGIEVSRVIVDGSCSAVIGNFTNFAHKGIKDVSFVCPHNPNVPAIDLSWPYTESINDPCFSIKDVRIAPEPSVAFARGWKAGIRINHGWNGRITDVFIHGDNNNNDGLLYGIQLDGRSMDVVISGTQIYGATTGIDILGDCEGPLVNNSLMMACGIGLYSRTTVERPWLSITNSHIAARHKGILLEKRAQATISGNLIYRGPTSENGFTGIYLSASQDARVAANQVYVLGNIQGQTNYGIVNTVPSGVINSNVIRGALIPIWQVVPGAVVADNFTAYP